MFKNLWFISLVAVYIIMMGSVFYLASKRENRTVRIDCTLVEISPDIPQKAKEECRKKLSGRL